MVLKTQEILNESSTSAFLKTPKFIDGFGSYYPEALEYNGNKYIIYQEPNELFYKNGKCFVKVVKLQTGLTYGQERKYSTMLFDNGKISPFPKGISPNNRADMNKKHPIIETNDGYMKYDEDLNCSQLEGIPEGYIASRWNIDNQTMQLNYRGKDGAEDKPNLIYTIDENYILRPINGVPKGSYIYEIKENIARIGNIKEDSGTKPFFYNQTKKQVEPFSFKGLEETSYEIEAFNTDSNVISVKTEDGKVLYFYFAGKAKVVEQIISHVEGKISELNKNSQTARMYGMKDNREGFSFYNNGLVVPFTGLAEGEKIEYHDTYQFINANSKVRAVVVVNDNMKTETRTYNQQGVIKPIGGLKEGWRVGVGIRRSSNGDFYFVPIKIKGFGDEVLSMLSKDSEKIISYNDMLIGGINPKTKQITAVTHEGPDCDIVLNDEERTKLMKDWNPKYKTPVSSTEIVEQSTNDIEEVLR